MSIPTIRWQCQEDEFSIYVEDVATGEIIADVRRPRVSDFKSVAEAMQEHRERARLLASAPELIDLIGTMVNVFQNPKQYDADKLDLIVGDAANLFMRIIEGRS